MAYSKKRTRRNDSNRNSRITTDVRPSSLFARTTYTDNRDPGSLVAIVDTQSNNATDFVVSRGGSSMKFSGNEARTLLQLLEKHYFG